MKKHLLLSISLLASLWYGDAMAEQTYVTVGTGTSSQCNVPYCNFYKHGSVQLIYPASEMSGAGKITGIAFQVASAQEYATTEVNIYMGSNSSETFASADDYVPLSDLTLVYSGSPKLGTAAGWEEIQLTTPFEYDGSNLVVAIGKHASSYTSNLKYAYTSKSNTVLYRQNDNSSNYGDVDETEIAYTLANTRANVRFTMDLPITTVGGIIYSCKNGEATVSKTTADLPTEVVIPSSVTYKGQNCTVKYVRMSAFSGNTSITSVSFPSTVVEIDKGSFTGCTALSSVSLSSSLGAIPDNTFWGCSSLTKITVPTSIATIGEYAFCRSGLTEISVPSSVKSIGSHAFYRCDSLASLTLAEGSISRIEDFTFCYCKKLENVKIPESVNYIGRGAFYECLKLETINIPDGVTRLGSFAFKNCINLSEISIPAGIDSIEMHTFYYCRAMTKAELPANLKRIGESAFHYCYDLAECEIPASVTYIGQLAFASCSDLPSISIPSGLEHLGIGAFQSCSSLKSVTVPSCITQIPKNLFSGCYNLKEVQLPDNLIAIGDYGFYGCAINKTNWPATLQSVGYLALGGSSNFKTPVIPKADEYDKLLLWANSAMDKVYCYSEVILPDSVFHVDDIYNTTLYVKPSMLDAYRESQWASRFKSIMPLGDINSDGLYSVADEVLAINTMNGIELPPFNNYRLTNADLTGDGIIDATDLQTQAELIASGDEITPFAPIDPDAPKPVNMLTPSENCTVLYTTGMFGSDTEMALDYINQMRFEACIEGVPNPDKSSTYLKESDFVPIRWSTDLERCCRVRCSESLYTCGHHARLNGKSIGSVSFNGISAGSENLGWGGYGSVMGSIFRTSTRSWMTALSWSNSTVEMSASPSVLRCFSIIELKPPMVSRSRPPMEPLRSRMNTTSVRFFFMSFSSVTVVFSLRAYYSIRKTAYGRFAGDKSRAKQALVKGEKCFVDIEHVIVAVGDEIFHDDVEFAGTGQCKSCLHQHLTHFLQWKLQGNRKRQHRRLARTVQTVAAYFGKQLAVDVRLLIAFRIGHTAFVDLTQEHFGKALVDHFQRFVQTRRSRAVCRFLRRRRFCRGESEERSPRRFHAVHLHTCGI